MATTYAQANGLLEKTQLDEPGAHGTETRIDVATRRDFLIGTLTASSMALCILPRPAEAQTAPEEVRRIGELKSQNGRLQAVMTIRNEVRTLPNASWGDRPERKAMLRYFAGKDTTGNMWPPAGSEGVLLPGPTLRARVGDQVEITFLNHVKVEEFPGGTFDNAETGIARRCDATSDQSGRVYPQNSSDVFPDCFHGSSTANMHFHGTHVTPDGLGDNVLLQLRPDPNVTEASVQAVFSDIFAAGPPARWDNLPKTWRDKQLSLLQEYDDNAVWQGKRGTPANPALPLSSQLLPQTLELIKSGNWPQYQIGAYPFCFKLTEYADKGGKPTGKVMGQCPGTHWYHAHKHGSTAINVYNGMAGVFVIEGDYDDALVKIYPNLKQTEKVLIVQQFSDLPNLERMPRAAAHALFVNGQLKPTITMRPGEIQLWRFVNATVKAVCTVTGFQTVAGNSPEIRQTAQDGVQFRFENYDSQPLLKPAAPGGPPAFTLAAGNRVDVLVKAPSAAGAYSFSLEDMTAPGAQELLTLVVNGTPVTPPMEFPTKENYPTFPPFLGDIDPQTIRIRRTINFGWEAGRSSPGGPPPPQYKIDGGQFLEGRYDQTMVLGDAEEWTLTNSTASIAHPFHIHVNPFQVVEIYDPATKQKYNPTSNFIWQDVIAIPPSTLDSNGKVTDLGYVKIRHRFVDFTGSYVLHCHMLAHEDRGMMQLVRVIPGETEVHHH
jgi:FtsP/CotA-like multicopper oxidase with cupredoxin domain